MPFSLHSVFEILNETETSAHRSLFDTVQVKKNLELFSVLDLPLKSKQDKVRK